jgi:hypothetical protein
MPLLFVFQRYPILLKGFYFVSPFRGLGLLFGLPSVPSAAADSTLGYAVVAPPGLSTFVLLTFSKSKVSDISREHLHSSPPPHHAQNQNPRALGTRAAAVPFI